MFTGNIQLYDVTVDLGEENNLAAKSPELVSRAAAYMKAGHVDNPNGKVRAKKPKAKK